MNNKPKKKQRKKWQRVLRKLITLVIILAVLGVGGWIGYDSLKSEYTTTYDAYTASIGSISNSLSFSGSLQLVNSQTCTATANTTVRTVYVSEGDTVKKGDKLMRLANGDSFEADFDGVVNQVYVEKDDDVTAGTQLLQVADFTHQKVSVRVDEYDISEVQVGMSCVVTATAVSKSYPSSIASINYISASNGNVAYYTTTCYVDVDEGVYPGMQVTITIPQEEANDVVVLKEDALSFDADNNAYVYVKNESGEMETKTVEVGVSNGNYVEIKSGLESGDTVYAAAKTKTTSGLASLLSGTFGSTQVNQPTGGGSWGGGSRGGSSDGSGFTMPSGGGSGGGSMPSGGGFPGN